MALVVMAMAALAYTPSATMRTQAYHGGAGSRLARSAVSTRAARPTALRMGLFGGLFGGNKGDESEDPRMSQSGDMGGALGMPMKENKYFDMINNISAPELVQNFAETAPDEVQQAVRATIMGLFGTLPPGMFESAVISPGKNVASLLYSMQMTGYMFKNAQYRLSLKQSLDKAKAALPGELGTGADAEDAKLPKVSGKVTVDIGGRKVEVDAESYVADLHKEVRAACVLRNASPAPTSATRQTLPADVLVRPPPPTCPRRLRRSRRP